MLDMASSGIMWRYMSMAGSKELSITTRIRHYLYASLRVYRVPEEKIQKAVAFTEQLDLSAIAQQTVQQMITSLELLSAA